MLSPTCKGIPPRMQDAALRKRGFSDVENPSEEGGSPRRQCLFGSTTNAEVQETPPSKRQHPDRSSDRGPSKRQCHASPGGHAESDSPAPEGIPASMLSPQERQISTALSLRKKYSLGIQQLTCQLVGFDPANRDGLPLGGHRCDQLLGDIFCMGFDLTEAQHDNVCVCRSARDARKLATTTKPSAMAPRIWHCSTNQRLHLAHYPIRTCINASRTSWAERMPPLQRGFAMMDV